MIRFGGRASVIGNVASIERSIPVTAGSSFSTSASDLGTEFSAPILEGLISQNEIELYSLYREIYMNDSVCGPAVDIISSLPWSDCDLVGIEDSAQLRIFEDTISELGIIPTMTMLSTLYLVLGSAIGSLLFDANRGIFTDIMILNPEDCKITPIPLRGYDPKIDLKVSPEIKKFLVSKDPRDKEAHKEISSEWRKKLESGKIELEPLSTLFIQRTILPRRYMSGGLQAMSYYSRVLPIWLIEKALMRGTIIGAWRRQRSVLHISVGNGDDWIPTDDQLSQVTQLFQNADRDPQGAVVATREGINTNELRQGSDFWKVSDEWDIFANAKMRALGINEGLLSGETTYASAEVAHSVFMENIRAFRDTLTQAVWYDKVFLLLAKYHGFKTRTKAEITNRLRLSDTERNRDVYGIKRACGMYASRNLAEAAKYNTPTIRWHKELRASGDTSILDLLKEAKELKIPVPLAMFATACGISMEAVVNSFEEDIKYRKLIKDHQDRIKREKLNLTSGGDGEEEEAGMFGSASGEKLKKLLSQALDISSKTNPEPGETTKIF